MLFNHSLLSKHIRKHSIPTLIKISLYLDTFRRKPAITKFDWLITPNHRSFQSFATLTDTVTNPIVIYKLELIPAHD